MTILIVAEHDGRAPHSNFRAALAAASQLGGEMEALALCGGDDDARGIAEALSRAPGLSAVRLIQNAAFANGLGEKLRAGHCRAGGGNVACGDGGGREGADVAAAGGGAFRFADAVGSD